MKDDKHAVKFSLALLIVKVYLLIFERFSCHRIGLLKKERKVNLTTSDLPLIMQLCLAPRIAMEKTLSIVSAMFKRLLRTKRLFILLTPSLCMFLFLFFNISRNGLIYIPYSHPLARHMNFANTTEVSTTPLWRPSKSKLQMIYRCLNITDTQPLELPLTLNFDYRLNNPGLCGKEPSEPVDALFMVHTAPLNFQRRSIMRRTIVGEGHFRPFKVRVVFLIGNTVNSTDQVALELEHRQYGDLLQGLFLDTYRNLTHKGVMGYGWISKYCPQAQIVVKIDDDVYVDTYKLLHKFRAVYQGKTRAIFCNVWHNNTMPILRGGKWKVSGELFYSRKLFPFDYCSGMSVLITGDLIPSLFRAATYTPFFWIDDVYLFGILPYVAGGVTFYNIGFSRNMTMNCTQTLECIRSREHSCSIVASHCPQVERIGSLWNATFDLHKDSSWIRDTIRID